MAVGTSRLPAIDIARGVAIIAMVVYHFAWDLNHFRFIEIDAVAGGWWLFARSIAASFLFLVGVSLVLAHGEGIRWEGYLRRLASIVAAAAIVSAASWYSMPDAPIFFGILHHIALASVVGLAFVRAPLWLVLAAALVSLVLPVVAASPAFNQPWLLWIGLSTVAPASGDYVPLVPGFAAVLAGIAAARGVGALPAVRSVLAQPRDGRFSGALGLAGRHSLVIYLVHQPLLFGLIGIAAMLVEPQSRQDERAAAQSAFIASCEGGCLETGGTDELCARMCVCSLDRIVEASLWDRLQQSESDPDIQERVSSLVNECAADILGTAGDGPPGSSDR